MVMRFRDATSALRTAVRIRVRDAGGVLRTVQRVRVRDAGGVLRTVYNAMGVALSAPSVLATDSGNSISGSVTSSALTVTPTGGVAPYTYFWEEIAGSGAIAADTNTAASTTFSANVYDGYPEQSTYRVAVTDANGTVATADAVVTLRWVNTA